jgi:hypothetical protein
MYLQCQFHFLNQLIFKNQSYFARLNHLNINYSDTTRQKSGKIYQCAMTKKMIYKTTTVIVILSICLSSFQIQLSHAVEVLCSKHEFNMALVHLKTCSIQGKKNHNRCGSEIANVLTQNLH